MDTGTLLDLTINVLLAICAALAALAVIFLAVRPLIDPHWRDRYADEQADDASPGARRASQTPHGTMLGT